MVRALLVVVLAIAFSAGAGWALVSSGWFDVRAVAVSGTARVRPADVRAAAAIAPGIPLVLADVAGARRRIAALPPVAGVEVRRVWPSKLRIEVRERQAVVAVPTTGGALLLDSGGVPFATEPRVPRRAIVLHVAGPDPSDPATRAALGVVAALSPEIRGRVAAISAPSPDSMTLALRGGAAVVWGSATATERKAAVLAVLLQRRARTYDVSTPDVVTTR